MSFEQDRCNILVLREVIEKQTQVILTMNLKDFYILKDGIPVFSLSDAPQENYEVNPEGDQLTMISGFLSAVSSFGSALGKWGEMQEVKMTGGIKMAFSRRKIQQSELLFIGITDVESPSVFPFVRRIIVRFMESYQDLLQKKWNGNMDAFAHFRTTFNAEYAEFRKQLKVHQQQLYGQQQNLLIKGLHYRTQYRGKINSALSLNQNAEEENNVPGSYQDFLENVESTLSEQMSTILAITPIKTVGANFSAESYFQTKREQEIFKAINGQRSFLGIAKALKVSPMQVYDYCKCFVKQGFVRFCSSEI